MPIVSLFMPTHARFESGHLRDAIDSALGQSFENFELLVVDDGSIDGTAQYLQEVAARDPRVRVTRLEQNTGLPAYALAQAYPSSNGRILAWLFDDCVLEPQHLERLVETLDANPDAAMAYGKVRARLTEGDEFEIGSPLDMAALEAGANMIPNVCVAFRREVVETTGWYDHHVLLKRLCDWDLWRRIAREHPVVFIDEVLASEHGVGLPLSLGRLHQAVPALALRYSALDRRDRLAPGELRYEDAFEVPADLDLGPAERADVDLVCFEHAMLTSNHVLARRLARRMREDGAIEPAFARYAARNARAAASGTTLLVATMELLRRRLARAAHEQIEAEVHMRRALGVAEIRYAHILGQEDEIRARDARLGAQAQESVQAQHAMRSEMQTELQARDARILVLDDALQVSQRMQEAMRLELANITHALLVHRDAADQRMSLLQAAHARIAELEVVAQQRLGEMVRLQDASRIEPDEVVETDGENASDELDASVVHEASDELDASAEPDASTDQETSADPDGALELHSTDAKQSSASDASDDSADSDASPASEDAAHAEESFALQDSAGVDASLASHDALALDRPAQPHASVEQEDAEDAADPHASLDASDSVARSRPDAPPVRA